MNTWGSWSRRSRWNAKAIAGFLGLLAVGLPLFPPMVVEAQDQIPGSDGWSEIAVSDAGFVFFLHTPSVRKAGSARFYWVKIAGGPRGTYTYYSLDCVGANYRQRVSYSYRGNQRIDVNKNMTGLFPVEPETIYADIMKQVCN